MTATTQAASTQASLALDIVYGPRDDTKCSLCSRHIPGTGGRPAFELETDAGDPLCLVCSDKQHKGLRLVCAVMNFATEAHTNGDKRTAEETIRGLNSALELLQEAAPKVPYQRPVRAQPVRHNRRGRKR